MHSETSQGPPPFGVSASHFGLNSPGRDVTLVTVMLGQDAIWSPRGCHVLAPPSLTERKASIAWDNLSMIESRHSPALADGCRKRVGTFLPEYVLEYV